MHHQTFSQKAKPSSPCITMQKEIWALYIQLLQTEVDYAKLYQDTQTTSTSTGSTDNLVNLHIFGGLLPITIGRNGMQALQRCL